MCIQIIHMHFSSIVYKPPQTTSLTFTPEKNTVLEIILKYALSQQLHSRKHEHKFCYLQSLFHE